MSDRMLRWGLLCTARINRAVIPPLRQSARAELVGVASRRAERAQAYAAEWNIPRAYDSYEALLADPDVDVIYNALPNALHCKWTIEAAEAGKHILCEKPLALTVEDVDRMVDAAQRNNVVLLEAFMYRHHPQTLKVQELVRDGAVGRPLLMHGVYYFTLDRPDDVRWRSDLGGGSLWDVGCYPVSFARAVAGSDPVEVFGQQMQADTPFGRVDATFAGQLRFANGALAQVKSGFEAPLGWGFEIVGTAGKILVDVPWKPGLDGPAGIRLRRGDTEEAIPVEDVDPYLCEVEAMAACILDDAEPIVSLEDTRGNVATINALYESARERRPVQLVD